MQQNGSMTSTDEESHGELGSPSSSNSHRPIHYTQSVPKFIEERRIHHLQTEELDGRRSRSHSEPLTRDAIKIAHELRRASDLFNTNYELSSSPTTKRDFSHYRKSSSRRITVAGSGGDVLRQELDQLFQSNGNVQSFTFKDPNPLPPEGTPV